MAGQRGVHNLEWVIPILAMIFKSQKNNAALIFPSPFVFSCESALLTHFSAVLLLGRRRPEAPAASFVSASGSRRICETRQQEHIGA